MNVLNIIIKILLLVIFITLIRNNISHTLAVNNINQEPFINYQNNTSCITKEIDELKKVDNKKKLLLLELSDIFKLILKKYQFSKNRFLLLKKKILILIDNYSFYFVDTQCKFLNFQKIQKYPGKMYLKSLIVYFFILNQDLKSLENILKDFFDLNGDIYTRLSNNNYMVDANNKVLLVVPQDRKNVITQFELSEILIILKKKKEIISIFDITNISNYYNQLNQRQLRYNNKQYQLYHNKILSNDPELSYYAKINKLLSPNSKKNDKIRSRYNRTKNWNIQRQWIDKNGPNNLLFYYSKKKK